MMARLMGRLAAVDFQEVPQDVAEVLRTMYAMVSTKLVEDAFQRLRVQETRGQASRVVRYERMWHTLVSKNILEGLHNYQEIDFKSVGYKRTLEELPRHPPKKLYTPAGHKPALPLHQVVSTKQQALHVVASIHTVSAY